MQTIRFPSCIGHDVDRAIAIVRQTLGWNTRVYFKIVWGDRRDEKIEANVVTLFMDSKWNAVQRTPVFLGMLESFNKEEEDLASVVSEE